MRKWIWFKLEKLLYWLRPKNFSYVLIVGVKTNDCISVPSGASYTRISDCSVIECDVCDMLYDKTTT